MRKNYDKELDQEKSHQDNISLDFKSQIVQKDRELRQSVTKVEMVSQGLIKDNDAAQAKYRLLEAENAKLKSIVEDRNKEIKQLNERVKTLLKDREDEAVRLNQIIGDLTKHFEEEKHKADNDRQQFREALSKKEESYQQLNLNLNAQIKELQRQIQDNLKQIDDLKHAVSLKESSIAETQDKLKHELSHLSAEKGNAERLTLEKDTANSEMREKLINSQREQMEKMKKDLKDKLASYEHEIEDLKRQLAVKVRELEESEAREQGMGQRLDVMVESTQRLKDL
jgi:chromosome segregation protein